VRSTVVAAVGTDGTVVASTSGGVGDSAGVIRRWPLEVLEALGRHLTDKQQAKAARKAVIKHRSWLANR
jgi:hypothetical protein